MSKYVRRKAASATVPRSELADVPGGRRAPVWSVGMGTERRRAVRPRRFGGFGYCEGRWRSPLPLRRAAGGSFVGRFVFLVEFVAAAQAEGAGGGLEVGPAGGAEGGQLAGHADQDALGGLPKRHVNRVRRYSAKLYFK